MQLAGMARLMNPVCLPPTNLSFALPLSDAGAGAVSTAPTVALGSATATFTRATAATTVDSNGNVVSVATGVARSMYDPSSVIRNLCLQSEDFTTTWAKSNSTVSANASTAPNGDLVADKLVENSSNTTHLVHQAISAVNANATYTYSVFAKAGERTKGIIAFFNGALTSGFQCNYDLAAGIINTPTAVGTGTATSSAIVAYPDGWYRLSITGVIDATSTTADIYNYMRNAAGSSTYTGDGASGLFLWGAQLELASSAGTYLATTTAARSQAYTYLGYLAEGARTNLCLQSEDFATTWLSTDTTITANSIASPDGAVTADLLTEGVAGTATVSQDYTGTSNTTQVFSFFAKRGNNDWIRAQIGGAGLANRVGCWFNLNTGAVGSVENVGAGTGAAGTIKAYPNGWYRCTLAGAPNNAETALRVQTVSASADGAGRVNSATRYQWGGQIENNVAFASSYIPTTTIAVARNADVLTYVLASNASASAATCTAELSTQWATADVSRMAIGITDANGRALYTPQASNADAIASFDGTSVASTSLSLMSTGVRKAASSWGGLGLRTCANGAAPGTAVFDGTMGSAGTVNIGIGGNPAGGSEWHGTVRNVRFWNTQLADADLTRLTA